MSGDTNFMMSTSIKELLEENKKITHTYKRFEFDSTSYNLLLCDINKVLKENANLKQALNEIREIINNCSDNFDDIMCYDIDKYKKIDILQIIDKYLGGSENE